MLDVINGILACVLLYHTAITKNFELLVKFKNGTKVYVETKTVRFVNDSLLGYQNDDPSNIIMMVSSVAKRKRFVSDLNLFFNT